MSGKEWIELINENMEEIRAVCKGAYKKAYDLEDGLQLSVELYDYGRISVDIQAYNGYDLYGDILDGKAIHLMTFSANGIEMEYFTDCHEDVMELIDYYIEVATRSLR